MKTFVAISAITVALSSPTYARRAPKNSNVGAPKRRRIKLAAPIKGAPSAAKDPQMYLGLHPAQRSRQLERGGTRTRDVEREEEEQSMSIPIVTAEMSMSIFSTVEPCEELNKKQCKKTAEEEDGRCVWDGSNCYDSNSPEGIMAGVIKVESKIPEITPCPVCANGITANTSLQLGPAKTCGTLIVDALSVDIDDGECGAMMNVERMCCPTSTSFLMVDPCTKFSDSDCDGQGECEYDAEEIKCYTPNFEPGTYPPTTSWPSFFPTLSPNEMMSMSMSMSMLTYAPTVAPSPLPSVAIPMENINSSFLEVQDECAEKGEKRCAKKAECEWDDTIGCYTAPEAVIIEQDKEEQIEATSAVIEVPETIEVEDEEEIMENMTNWDGGKIDMSMSMMMASAEADPCAGLTISKCRRKDECSFLYSEGNVACFTTPTPLPTRRLAMPSDEEDYTFTKSDFAWEDGEEGGVYVASDGEVENVEKYATVELSNSGSLMTFTVAALVAVVGVVNLVV